MTERNRQPRPRFLASLLHRGLGVVSRWRLGTGVALTAASYLLGRKPGLWWWQFTQRFHVRALAELAGPGDVAVDIGADVGFFTLLLARQVVPKGHVYAFEPEPNNLRALTANVRRSGLRNITIVPAAVASVSGTLSLHLSPVNPGDHRIMPAENKRRTVPVAAVSLDAYFHDKPGSIKVMKIDVQGAELSVLGGMTKLLADPARTVDLAMMIEYWPYGLRRAREEPAALLHRLVEAGFTLSRIDERQQGLISRTPSELSAEVGEEFSGYVDLICRRTTAASTGSLPVRPDR
ncbi:MAG: FkbM family methyltransferase [Parcubacteria group bacterium Gr01-1014_31]|nr:MAG: FkbM family methyltransferase [Parcubacteria group bacterium Gr01-1014_31]